GIVVRHFGVPEVELVGPKLEPGLLVVRAALLIDAGPRRRAVPREGRGVERGLGDPVASARGQDYARGCREHQSPDSPPAEALSHGSDSTRQATGPRDFIRRVARPPDRRGKREP